MCIILINTFIPEETKQVSGVCWQVSTQLWDGLYLDTMDTERGPAFPDLPPSVHVNLHPLHHILKPGVNTWQHCTSIMFYEWLSKENRRKYEDVNNHADPTLN